MNLARYRLVLSRDSDIVVVEQGRERKVPRPSGEDVFVFAPRWSPDASRVAFVRLEPIRPSGDWGDDVFAVEVQSGATRLLRPHVQTGEQVIGLNWTPDAHALILGVLQLRTANGRTDADYSVQRYELDTDRTTRLVEGGIDPSLSRDGRVLSYLRLTPTGTRLYVARGDGTGEREVVLQPRPATVFAPRISGDGRWIAFSAPLSGFGQNSSQPRGFLEWVARLGARRAEAHGAPMEVWRVNVESGAAEKLPGLLDDEPRPVWTRDGGLFVIATGALYEVSPAFANAVPVGAGQFGGDLDVAN